MNAKVKGFFRGLRYISSIFGDEEKEAEIIIGLPTDVKHVSHIGWDGLDNAESTPSWMKKFDSSEEVSQSTRSNVGNAKENPETLGNSEELQRKSYGANSPSKKSKSKNSKRRHISKEASENTNSNRQLQIQDNNNNGSIDSPKQYRKKKSKDMRSVDSSSKLPSRFKVKQSDVDSGHKVSDSSSISHDEYSQVS